MKKDQRGFNTAILIIMIAVILAGGIGAFAWKRSHKSTPSTSSKTNTVTSFAECVKAGNPVMESYPEQCAANGKTYSNPDQKVTTPDQAPTQKYLTIKEWGVRIPVSKADNTEDLVYEYRSDDSYEATFFTFQRLIDYGICKTDIGVAMSRTTVKNEPPYNIDNPEQLAHVGNYYYSASYGGSYCYDSENSKDSAFYKSTGISNKTVTDALRKLEQTPGL